MKEQKTIAEIMKAKHDDAIKSVTDLLWADADGNKVAAVAISGGLTVEKVQELECYVANARAELAKLEAFDVAKLKSNAAAAKAALEKIRAEFDKVNAQRSEAGRVSDAAAKQLYDAQFAYTEVANQVECGELPADRAPGTVNQVLARRKSGEEIHAMEQRLKDLIRLKQDNQDIVNHYTKQVDQAGSRRNNVVSTPGGFVSENDMMKQKLDKHTTD
ncbi:MAG: hypothetical protein WC340_15330, partial [Kiritimatiellia bacterium]